MVHAPWDAHPEPLSVDSAPLPEYGSGSLADLLPTLAAGLGVPGLAATIPELAAADRVCVLLIDGLGAVNVSRGPTHRSAPTPRHMT